MEHFQTLAEAYRKDFEWHKRFSEGRQNVEDDENPGQLSTSRTEENVVKINQIIHKDN